MNSLFTMTSNIKIQHSTWLDFEKLLLAFTKKICNVILIKPNKIIFYLNIKLAFFLAGKSLKTVLKYLIVKK